MSTVAGAISENSTCPVLTICSPDLRPVLSDRDFAVLTRSPVY